MKLSKLLFFAAAALCLGTACSDDEDPIVKTVEDAIALTPAKATVSSKGGTVSTMVTSSGEWSVSDEQNAFVQLSATTGNDGDIVKFAVQPNDKEEDRTFTYTFTCGTKQAQFVVTLAKKASQKEEQLELIYDEESATLPSEGGQVKVLVTSSSEWTLEGSYGFVHPSATSGEDGDEVIFDVDPNEEYEEKVADFVFTMGEKSVAFKIVVTAATPESIEIISAKEMRLAYTEEKRLAVDLKTDVDVRDLSVEIVSETEDWLTYTIARPVDGEGEANVKAYFAMAKNGGDTSREATVTFKGVKSGEATLKVIQFPESKIEPEKKEYFFSIDAQSFSVPVTANVEYDITVGEEGKDWLTFDGLADNALNFSLAALAEEGPARKCFVTLTEKNCPDNAEPVTVQITISQKPKGLIEIVADMRKSRCYFHTNADNPTPINNLKTGTMEALVNIQETRVDGSLSTIMGVEGKFLLRMGDAGLPWNQIQLATNYGNYTSTDLKLNDLDRWYHVAVTWGDSNVRFYIDGELIYETSASSYLQPSFGIGYTGYESNYSRAFWIGYAYDSNRWFPGYMSECRIWNRVLTADEIKAENHFYQADPASEGLVGYWKLNGHNEGDKYDYSVKDFSTSGNHMVGEINVHQSGSYHVGDWGMNYVETSLP